MPDPVALAQELIRCPSVTPEDAGALDVLRRVLEAAGFRCERLNYSGDGSYPVPNLYARFGERKPNFCFAGHTDVVPVGDAAAWRFDPFGAVIADGYLYGRGAEDMKSAIAAFAAAAIEVAAAAGEGLNGSISLLITGDEEAEAINGTRKVLATLAERGERLDACIVGEPTNPTRLGEMAKIGRRGSISATITVLGTQGHVAYPHLADNPVPRLLAVLNALGRPLDEGMDFFQPSNLEITSIDVGNPADNVIPARATAKVNIRFNPQHTIASLREWIETVCREHGGRHEVAFRITGEAFLTRPGPLSDLVAAAVKEVTGAEPELSTTGGTSDARFIKDFCPVVEFGTTGRTSHKVDENVAVEDIRRLSRIYRTILTRYFAG